MRRKEIVYFLIAQSGLATDFSRQIDREATHINSFLVFQIALVKFFEKLGDILNVEFVIEVVGDCDVAQLGGSGANNHAEAIHQER